ncbi:YraN family protein [Chloroflexus sp.]|uniref:YraN family protein n=1 Tax=Chloroflexus sp. TaxID=1904827 RepID=UPI0026316F0C|nr:YraN family protein [uncultured Chloroflexus sp.]
MPTPKRRLGDRGEQVAVAYLEQRGYVVIARNWRCRFGEIDLVARDGDQLVFVEVRARHDPYALESITPRKRQRLITLAYSYLMAQDAPPTTDWRIDVIALTVIAGRMVVSDHVIAAIGEEGEQGYG